MAGSSGLGLVRSTFAVQDGSHQFQRPISCITDGTSRARITVASKMIPAALIQHGGLGRNVVVAGVRDHLEIWDRAAWRKELKEVEGSAEDVAERLAN